MKGHLPKPPLPVTIGLLIIFALAFILPYLSLHNARQERARQDKTVERVFNAEYFTLENGLEIVVIPNHRAPVVTHMVWYKVGAADEEPGKSGIAHFMEHLMFKGSEGLKPGEFSEIIRSLGGNDNAFTGQDYTAYFQSIAKEHLPTVMRMEAGRMRGMNPPPEEVESERLVILEERSQRIDNDPRARFNEQLNAALYVNHPYGTPVIGWRHEMETLSRADAMNFYDRWYGPHNAILVVSGDVTGDEVLSLARQIYGPLLPGSAAPRERIISPPLPGKLTIEMADERVREPNLIILRRAPSSRQDEAASLSLQVLEEILGGGPSSRFYRSLVVEQKAATSAGLSYSSSVWDDGEVTLYATPAPGQRLAALKDLMEDEIRRIITEGVSDDELFEAITRLQAKAVYARDSLTGPAMIVGRALATGQSLDQVETWPSRIALVNAGDVRQAAARYLNPDVPSEYPSVTGYLIPKVQETSAQ